MSYVIARIYPNQLKKFDLELGHSLSYNTLKIAKQELKDYYTNNGQWDIYKLKLVKQK